jgi:hypothetical protein
MYDLIQKYILPHQSLYYSHLFASIFIKIKFETNKAHLHWKSFVGKNVS